MLGQSAGRHATGTMERAFTVRSPRERLEMPTPPKMIPILRTKVRSAVARVLPDNGAATAEYAIATMAAVGFAGLLVVIMRSDAVRGMLTDLVQRALTFAG